ncbi:hypothetical protein [Alloacidobacterium sp.]|uniref:hypothetical protein n=1 Tax=Alloacidobacterium sp. TaxID=2951999 RepID=UPI002D43D402|nr:hypothetical protein [Alloacidobacterium sp.]HYK34388.1 hypothetical protein [Alloacidobacterium sp.]
MRTSLSIDNDVANLLKQEMRRSGESFKGTVNRLLRLGLTAAHRPPIRKRFVVKARRIVLPARVNYDKTEEILEALEDSAHK